jgi:hypothetical protein
MPIVLCIPEDASDPPFPVFLGCFIALGAKLYPGANVYEITGITITDEDVPKIESVTVRPATY